MSEDLARLQEIFTEALSKSTAADRAAYLDHECAADVGLRRRVEALLTAHEAPNSFLDLPDAVLPGTSPGRIAESPGTMIGDYRLLEQIGEGGFGSVFMAQQEQPIRRRVALKIIKLGMDTRQIVARFEVERQALAMMDHPGIAKIFDAGVTASGRPYFVMELFKGTPITRYCDENNLNIQKRLELFAQVCQAVQHAHQKGLIHRDLKPSNVLVSTQDDRPMAKIIDFGIAKATEARLTEKTVFTEFRQLIGTPEYMSPEQALGTLDIDTRSDVYALGVLLYELLTGSPPFDSRELRSKAFAEMQRIIREVDPPTPSTRLSESHSIASVAARRSIEPRELNAILRGELDWIVMKCLEKDRARRYESASALAGDVMHYLADEPVLAAAPSKAYRFRKFVRRNRVQVIASLAVLSTLLAGIVGTSIGLIGQTKLRIKAQEQEVLAKHESANSSAVSRFLVEMLSSADPDKMLGDKVTVVQSIAAAEKELDGGQLKNQPLVEAQIREAIGNTLRALGHYDAAEPNSRKALELRRSQLPADHEDIGTSLSNLALLLQDQGKFAEAESLQRQALDIHRKQYRADHPELSRSINNLAAIVYQEGKMADAERLFREALSINRQAYPAGDKEIAKTLNNLAVTLTGENKLAESELLLREALTIARRSNPPGHPDIAIALDSLGQVFFRQGKFDEAEPFFRESLEIKRKSLPAGHPGLAQALNSVSSVFSAQGKFDESESLAREALEIDRKALPPDHPDIAANLNSLAALFQMQGKLAEAEAAAREALGILRRALPADHPDLARNLYALGVLLRNQGKFAEAEAPAEATEIGERVLGRADWRTATFHTGLGQVLFKLGRYQDAEAELLLAERILTAAPNTPPQRRVDVVEALAAVYSAWDQSDPDKDHAAQAQHWRSMLPPPATVPSTAKS